MPTELIDLDASEEARAERLHQDAIVIDGLAFCFDYFEEPGYGDHFERGGVTAGNFSVSHAGTPDLDSCLEETMRHRDVVEADDALVLVESAADVREAKADGEVGVILGFQDTRPLGTDRWRLRAFERLGVRIVQLTYNERNFVGSGCCEASDGGLSNFGRELVDELNRRSILIDLSHCADRTTMEAIERSADPVAFTHVGVRELCPVPGRSKTDEQLEAVAETGGVVGITFFPPFVKRDPETHEVREATVHDVLDAIDYVVDLVGPRHVGFGTDMNDVHLDRGTTPDHSSLPTARASHPEVFGRGPTDRYDPFPRGIDRHTKLPNLTRGLVSRGYADDEIEGILGGNFLRLFEAVWAPF